MSNQETIYRGFIIRAFEQRPGSWRAELRKQDGSMILREGMASRASIEIPKAYFSAADAIAAAKEGIDSPTMK
jgi:hypothetical protein